MHLQCFILCAVGVVVAGLVCDKRDGSGAGLSRPCSGPSWGDPVLGDLNHSRHGAILGGGAEELTSVDPAPLLESSSARYLCKASFTRLCSVGVVFFNTISLQHSWYYLLQHNISATSRLLQERLSSSAV
ncbi:hypothetical protein MRB53_005399 [Persea americana]|uniref:Uncharacterized protein n=1 Tax=Persea americana TaxID=3435 RepID=A0ACC2MDD1_PERAE|nr:hypothetical protein MRB53_005399 [Persea americana]